MAECMWLRYVLGVLSPHLIPALDEPSEGQP